MYDKNSLNILAVLRKAVKGSLNVFLSKPTGRRSKLAAAVRSSSYDQVGLLSPHSIIAECLAERNNTAEAKL